LRSKSGENKKKAEDPSFPSGRCYDHNLLRFSTTFGEKNGIFLKNQCYDPNFAEFSFVLSQKRQFFADSFRRKYFKNHNIGPRYSFARWIGPNDFVNCTREQRLASRYAMEKQEDG
jgi:hypothetical protein